MAIRIIYDQTQPATANGEATGWIKVLDVTQLVAGCTGFIYDHDTGPIAVRVEAIDSPNSKLQLSRLDDSGSYVVGSLVAYTVTSGTAVKIPQQAREDAGYVPPSGGAIAGIAALGSTVGSGFVTFVNSNGVTFGLSNNVMTASAVGGGGGGGGIALSAGNYSTATGTVVFANSNGMSFGMDTNGEVTASYTTPDISQINFSNSNNVSFGVNGWTVTAIASFTQTVQTQGLVNIEGSTGTIHFDNANGISFGGNNNTITASVVIPPQTVQTQNLVSIEGSTGNIYFDNANGFTFGGNNSTITASYTVPTVPAQTVQPVAASASNGSFLFSTLGFNNGGGVTFSSDVNGVNASVKTDYQSSNANYLTTQTVQPGAVSGSNGSFTYSTLSLGASNGATFYTTNGSVVVSYTVPNVVAQTYQPGAYSGSNGSFTASTLSFGISNGVTFYTTNGSLVASIPIQNPNIAISAGTTSTVDTHFAFVNSNNVSFGLATLNNEITASATWPAQSVQPVAISGSNGSSLFSTLTMGASNGLTHYMTNGSLVASYTVPGVTVFSNSNNVTFGLNGSTVTASATVTYPAQTVQPVAASASNGSFNFSTIKFVEGSGVTWATQVGGIQASVKTDYQSSNANYLTSQTNQALSGSNGSFAFQTATFGNSNGATFYTTNGSMVVSYTVPAIPGATVFSNSNNVTFGLNGSTITASVTVAATAQTVQPVAASASNGSFNFSTIKFVEGSGVTWATQVGGVQASVKTDYQSSNANYLTSQSNQALSGSNGSFAFQTASFGASNGATFYTTNGSLVVSYTVPSVPGATVFSNSNNVTFGLNGSTVTASASFVAQTAQPVAASASNGSFNFSTLKFVEGSGVTWATQVNGIQASIKTDYQSSNANYLTSQSTGPSAIAVPGTTVSSGTIIFSNSNGVTFGYGTGTASNIITVTVQPGAAAGIAAINAGSEQATNGTVTFANSNGVTFGMGTGGSAGVITASISPAAATGIGAIAGGGNTATSGTVVFSNSNNVSFSFNGSTQMVASASFNQTAQPVVALGISTAGNTQGTSGSFNTGTYIFEGSNGLSVSQITNAASANVQTLRIIAPTQTAFVFSNSNNVSFTANGSTINASASFPAQTVQPVAASGSNGSFLFSTLTFGASNGATFYTTNNSVVVSYTVPNVPAQTVQPVAVSGSNGSFAFSTLTMGASNGLTFYTTNGSVVGSYTVPTVPGATVFSNSNNVTFGLNGSTVTASASFVAQTVQPVAASASNGSFLFSTLKFVEGSGVTWATQAGGVQASVKTDYQSSNANYLTSQTNQTIGVYASGNQTGTTVSSLDARSFTVFGAGNVSVGFSGGQLYVSATGGGGGGAAVGISTAGNTQGTSGNFSNGTYIFEGSNGLSVSQLTAATPGVQTLRLVAPTQSTQPVAISGSNGSSTFNTLTAGSSNGMHFYLTNGSLVGSYTVPGATVFSNSNNVTFGINGSTVTASASFVAQTVQPVAASASNGSFLFSTIKFVEGSGVTWATQANGIQASVKTDYQSSNANYLTSQTVQPVAFSAANGSALFSTLKFADTLGHTWSTGTQGVYLASDADQASYYMTGANTVTSPGAASSGTIALYSQIYSGQGGVSVGMSGNTVLISGNQGTVNQTGPNIAAGGANAATVTAGTVIFSNSNNVSFGLGAGANSTQMTASASVAEAGVYWAVPPWHAQSAVILTWAYLTLTAMSQRPVFYPFEIIGNMTASQLRLLLSRQTSGQNNSFTVQNGIYSQVNATSMALISSTQVAFANTDNAASITGVKIFQMPLGLTSLSKGQYYLGLMFSANGGATSAMNYYIMGGGTVAPPVGSIVHTGSNSFGLTTNAAPFRFWGRLSATAQMPANVVTADLSSAYMGVSQIPMLFTIADFN
jgi:hypothetical protein